MIFNSLVSIISKSGVSFFFGVLIEHVRVHLHTKNRLGDCIIWRGVSYLVFNVLRNHSVYTRDLYLYGITMSALT